MIDLARIETAAEHVDPVFLGTPLVRNEMLDRRLGAKMWLKVETLTPIRSFKGRGADWLVHNLKAQGVGEVVCASAGNFGQGIAYASRNRGLKATVFVAEDANTLKIDAMRGFGAEVILQGQDFDAAKAAARDYAAEHQARFVEDGKEDAITEGAGTLGIELGTSQVAFHRLLIPVGNGALLGGVGTWCKQHMPSMKVHGVMAAGAPAMVHSWQAKALRSTDSVNTIADGVAVRVPVSRGVELMLGVMDEATLVDDNILVRAMALVFETVGLVVEPAGALGIAAVLARPEQFRGQTMVTILCGGNVTPTQAAQWLAVGPDPGPLA